MPVYDYKCLGKLQHEFEVTLTFADSDKPQDCPKCGVSSKRIIKAAPPIQYKGGGWPINEKRGF